MEKNEEELEPLEVGLGFEVPLGNIWIDPESQKDYQWLERWLVVKSNAWASRQIKGLENRLIKGEQALLSLQKRTGKDEKLLEQKIQELLKNSGLTEAVEAYKEQWQPERGFHRFKRGRLSALPIYFRDEEKIKGLMFLLTIALRVFTLMEFVVRRQLHQCQSSLAGLYDGNPKRTTDCPTAEKMLKAFSNITLYIHRDGSWEISCLNDLQQQILRLMNIPEGIYAADYFASG